MEILPIHLAVVSTLLLLQQEFISADFHLDNHPVASTIQFSIKFRRNETDHRIMQIHLKEYSGTASSNWRGNFAHTSIKSEGLHTNHIVGTVTVPPQRSHGYKLFPGLGYYKLHNIYTDFINASEICRDEGAHLAIINSDEEAAALIKVVGNHEYGVWIGVHDPEKNLNFQTIFGTPLNETGYSKWENGEPSGELKTDLCVLFFDEGLLAIECDVEAYFICEHDLSWDD